MKLRLAFRVASISSVLGMLFLSGCSDFFAPARNSTQVNLAIGFAAGGAPEAFDRLLEHPVNRGHPDVERDDADLRAPRCTLIGRADSNVHRRKIADRRGLTRFGPAFDSDRNVGLKGRGLAKAVHEVHVNWVRAQGGDIGGEKGNRHHVGGVLHGLGRVAVIGMIVVGAVRVDEIGLVLADDLDDLFADGQRRLEFAVVIVEDEAFDAAAERASCDRTSASSASMPAR